MCAAVLIFTFSGVNGTGACSCPGTKVGDYCFMYYNGSGQQQPNTFFEQQISVADEVQQIVNEPWSGTTWNVLILRSI